MKRLRFVVFERTSCDVLTDTEDVTIAILNVVSRPVRVVKMRERVRESDDV